MKEHAKELYIDRDFNCAETTLRLANGTFNLGLDEKSLELVGAFGGGLGCEITCGALCASMAAISAVAIRERAHATENFKEICAGYVAEFEKCIGCLNCGDIKEKNFREDVRCLRTVEKNAELLEAYLTKLSEK